jgi:hypothetical protein
MKNHRRRIVVLSGIRVGLYLLGFIYLSLRVCTYTTYKKKHWRPQSKIKKNTVMMM